MAPMPSQGLQRVPSFQIVSIPATREIHQVLGPYEQGYLAHKKPPPVKPFSRTMPRLLRAYASWRTRSYCGACVGASDIPGYLAHKKTHTPLGSPQGPKHRPTVVSWGGRASYERGTPVMWAIRRSLQGLLEIKDTHRPRALRSAYT